ncbi:Myb/SANT-like DNA-binding domain 4 [Dillenia turbinata]|uniref:Myb/SANT-like DNA-binding domain 4 n=1 Tax=Dillenia turbinata TaxID=194707 RepID=A0AAN8VSR6_9MAGN
MEDLKQPLSLPPIPQTTPFYSKSLPVREDCWTEDATATLIEAWGSRYLQLNRGNLRQQHWQEVANAVNHRHGHTKKSFRTDIQCKNRIDTLKKKYKIEKAKVLESNGSVKSSWIFFDRLDFLIGNSMKRPVLSSPPSPPVAIPLPLKKSTPLATASVAMDDSFLKRNYSAVAAAAAKEECEDEEEVGRYGGSDSEASRFSEEEEEEERPGLGEGIRDLARAIVKFGETYERIEGEKQRQMIELEKQRMQFVKDLEFQRMQMFMDSQVQLQKIKKRKRSNSNGKTSL